MHRSVRPLQASDLRFRKLCGRHQISSDGKHLIDGVAFGRPFVRRSERPAIRIPPRKRRRVITADDGDDIPEFSHDAKRQITFHAGFGNQNNSLSGSESSEDEAFEIRNDDVDENINDEVKDLQADLVDYFQEYNAPRDGVEMTESFNEGSLQSRTRSKRQKKNGLGLEGSAFLTDEYGRPYPTEYYNPLLDIFDSDDRTMAVTSNIKTAPERTQGGDSPTAGIHGNKILPPQSGSRQSSSASTKNVRFDDPKISTPATILQFNSADNSDDSDFEPSEDLGAILEGSDKENATPRLNEMGLERGIIDDYTLSSSSESEADLDKTSASSTSSSGTSDDEDQTSPSVDYGRPGIGTDTSSSSDSSSSSSTSEGDESATNREDLITRDVASSHQTQNRESQMSYEAQSATKSVPPGGGKRATQLRNQRRRLNKKLKRFKEDGNLPPHATRQELQSSTGHTPQQAQVDEAENASLKSQIGDNETHFPARSQTSSNEVDLDTSDPQKSEHLQPDHLLDHQKPRESYANSQQVNGIETDRSSTTKSDAQSSNKNNLEALANPTKTIVSREVGSEPHDDPATQSRIQQTIQAPGVETPTNVENLTSNNSDNGPPLTTSKSRSKLDIESSRRLLFGALGHRTPKTKEDEANLREKIMKDVKIHKEPPSHDKLSTHCEEGVVDTDNWKDKVDLFAVECCHDGVKLSTPPFPFVQRWDPQQQKGYFSNQKRLKKTKKRKRNHLDWEEPREDYEKVSLTYGVKTRFDESTSKDRYYQVNTTGDLGEENRNAANDQLLRETEATALAEARESFSGPTECLNLSLDSVKKFPPLQEGACIPSTIIAFKQLDMSRETNWQPRISEYRTASIVDVLEDNTLLLRLAPQDHYKAPRAYHSTTGERVHSKFEMPGYSDEESDENADLLELTFAEWFEPLLISSGKSDADEHQDDSRRISNDGHTPSEVEMDSQNEAIRGSNSIEHPEQVKKNELSRSFRDEEAAEEVRKDIYDLIKDAGWRSSIQSNATDGSNTRQDYLRSRSDAESGNTPKDVAAEGLHYPRFDGFTSSPPAREYLPVEDSREYSAIHREGLADAVAAEEIPDSIQDPGFLRSSSQIDRSAIRHIREDFENQLRLHELNPPEAHMDPSSDLPQAEAEITVLQESSLVEEGQNSLPTPPSTRIIQDTQAALPPMSEPSAPNPTPFIDSDDDEFPPLERVFSEVRSSFGTQLSEPDPIEPEHVSSTDDSNEHKELNGSNRPKLQDPLTRLPWISSQHIINNTNTTNDSFPSSQPQPKPTRPSYHSPSSKTTLPQRSKASKMKTEKPPKPAKPNPRSDSRPEYIGTQAQAIDLTLSSDDSQEM